jgi:glutathione S-transferase
MKLYDGGKAPNPRRVNLFLAEKGVQVERIPVDMGRLEHKGEELTKLNPLQTLPVLELDDGSALTETIAICRYIEETHPENPLMGSTAKEKALIEMWQRRVELQLFYAVAHAFRHLHPAMKTWEVPQVADWGEANKDKALKACEFLNTELADREFIAGDSFSIADITLLVALDFCRLAKIKVPENLSNLNRLHQALKERPASIACAL